MQIFHAVVTSYDIFVFAPIIPRFVDFRGREIDTVDERERKKVFIWAIEERRHRNLRRECSTLN